MTVRRSGIALVLTGVVLLAGCGGDADTTAGQSSTSSAEETAEESPRTAATRTSTTPSPSETAAAPSAATPSPAGGPVLDTAGTKPWRDLRAGECIADVPDGTFTDVGLIDCASPHEAEALSALRAVNLQGRPAGEAAQAHCDQALAASGITGGGVVAAPIVETQGTLLARAVCLVVNADGSPLTGSLVAG